MQMDVIFGGETRKGVPVADIFFRIKYRNKIMRVLDELPTQKYSFSHKEILLLILYFYKIFLSFNQTSGCKLSLFAQTAEWLCKNSFILAIEIPYLGRIPIDS